MKKIAEFFQIVVLGLILVVMVLLIGLIFGLSVLLRRVQYYGLRLLLLMGLDQEQKERILNLLQYKRLFPTFGVAGYELSDFEHWGCDLEWNAAPAREAIAAECRELHIPNWRICLAT